MSSRLHRLLGPAAAWLLDPGKSAVICLGGWLLSLPLAWAHAAMAGLSWTAFYLLLQVVRMEAPLLELMPFPPLTVLVLGMAIRWGLGPLLMAFSGSGGDPFLDIWVRYGVWAQLPWLILTATLVCVAVGQRGAIQRAAQRLPPAPWLKELREGADHRVTKQLRLLAIILTLFMGVYLVLSVLSGAFDRNFDAYVGWVNTLWRFDTPVAAFSRLRDLWFLLLPLWWRLLGPRWKLLLGWLLLTFVATALWSGSRGLLLYPTLLLLAGMWFVIDDPKKLRNLLLGMAVLVFVLSPLIYVMRESTAFQTAGSDPRGRAAALVQTLADPDPLFQKTRWLGRDLYACHDPYLFTPENVDRPRVGAAGLDALAFLWVPRHLLPKRPVIFDGHLIAKQLQNVAPSAWSQVWFPCFSLPADLLRRWGWQGVAAGALLVAIFINILARVWYQTLSLPGSSFQLLLLLFPATYLQSFPFGTVAETCWAMAWELPKYLLALWILGGLVDRLSENNSQ